MNKNIILDLCGGTGSWSKPYKQNGYDVIVVDLLTGMDIRDFDARQYKGKVQGVLMAPPCTEFSSSGARWWKDKDPALLEEAIAIVKACLAIKNKVKPDWWALENPRGRIAKCVPELQNVQRWSFQPHHFGDKWVKETFIWGEHNIPEKKPIKWPPNNEKGMDLWKLGPFVLGPKPSRKQIENLVEWGLLDDDWEERFGPNPSRALLRSITPPKFAKAFYEANP